MDSNILSPADTAVATMRTLPWLNTSTPTVVPDQSPMRGGAMAFPVGSDHAITMPVSAVYGGVDVDTLAPCLTAIAGTTVALAWGMNADHKFSTRLGPPPSPPV